MRIFITMFVLVTCIFACNPYKHYQGVATDTNVTEKKKQIISPWVNLYFPPEKEYVKGKDSIRIDTLIEIKDFDSLQRVIDALYAKGFDSLEVCQDALKDLMKNCKPKTITITKERIDTMFTESGPMIDHVKNERDRAFADRIIVETKNVDLLKENKEILEGRRNLWWIIIILALALAGSIYLHFKRR